LREDERIVLENLHPDHPRLATNLAGGRPQALVEARGKRFLLPLRCDTLWIDTERAMATLIWRGQLPLQRPDEAGRIAITLENARRMDGPAPEQDEDSAERPAVQTLVGGDMAKLLERAALPFAPAAPARPREEARSSSAGLPFVGSSGGEPSAWLA